MLTDRGLNLEPISEQECKLVPLIGSSVKKPSRKVGTVIHRVQMEPSATRDLSETSPKSPCIFISTSMHPNVHKKCIKTARCVQCAFARQRQTCYAEHVWETVHNDSLFLICARQREGKYICRINLELKAYRSFISLVVSLTHKLINTFTKLHYVCVSNIVNNAQA